MLKHYTIPGVRSAQNCCVPTTDTSGIEGQRDSKFHNKVSVSGWEGGRRGRNKHLKDIIQIRHLPS